MIVEKINIDEELIISDNNEKNKLLYYFGNKENNLNDFTILKNWIGLDITKKFPVYTNMTQKIENKLILFKLLDDNFYCFYDSEQFSPENLTKNLTIFKSIQYAYKFEINFCVKEKYGSFRKFIHLFIYYYWYLIRSNNCDIEKLTINEKLKVTNYDTKNKYIYCHSGKFLFSDKEYLDCFYLIIYILSNTTGFTFLKEYLKQNYVSIFKPFNDNLLGYYEDLYKYKLIYDERNQHLYFYVSVTTILFGFISMLLTILNVILVIKL